MKSFYHHKKSVNRLVQHCRQRMVRSKQTGRDNTKDTEHENTTVVTQMIASTAPTHTRLAAFTFIGTMNFSYRQEPHFMVICNT